MDKSTAEGALYVHSTIAHGPKQQQQPPPLPTISSISEKALLILLIITQLFFYLSASVANPTGVLILNH